jgi:hypothetical protein
MKLSTRIYFYDDKEKIIRYILENGGWIKKTRDGSDKYYLNLNECTAEYVPIQSTLYLIINPVTYHNKVNIGTLPLNKLGSIIQKILFGLGDFFETNSVCQSEWKIEMLEIRNDILCPKNVDKTCFIDACKKVTVGSYPSRLHYQDSAYMYSSKGALKIYDKSKELEANKPEFLYSLNESRKRQVKKIIRIEFELKHEQLVRVISRITGKKYTKILLGDIASAEIIKAIYQHMINQSKLSGIITTLQNAVKIIEEEVIGNKLRCSLINFIKFIV